jgi:hypothetical protein
MKLWKHIPHNNIKVDYPPPSTQRPFPTTYPFIPLTQNGTFRTYFIHLRREHVTNKKQTKQTPWPVSTSELYRPRDYRLSAKLVSTFPDTGCNVVSVTDPYGGILVFLDWSRYFFFQVAAQLYSRGWVDAVPDPLLLRKSGSAGNRTRTSGSIARNSDH